MWTLSSPRCVRNLPFGTHSCKYAKHPTRPCCMSKSLKNLSTQRLSWVAAGGDIFLGAIPLQFTMIVCHQHDMLYIAVPLWHCFTPCRSMHYGAHRKGIG